MATTYSNTKDPYGGTVSASLGQTSEPITPSDTVDMSSYPKAIVVTTGGDLVVVPLTGRDDATGRITFVAVPAGFVPPFRVRRVHATGTTAVSARIDG